MRFMPLCSDSNMNCYYHNEKSSLVCTLAVEMTDCRTIKYTALNSHTSSTHNLGFCSPNFMADNFTVVPQIKEIRV